MSYENADLDEFVSEMLQLAKEHAFPPECPKEVWAYVGAASDAEKDGGLDLLLPHAQAREIVLALVRRTRRNKKGSLRVQYNTRSAVRVVKALINRLYANLLHKMAEEGVLAREYDFISGRWYFARKEVGSGPAC